MTACSRMLKITSGVFFVVVIILFILRITLKWPPFGHYIYREMSDLGLDVLTGRAISRSIHQGLGLRVPVMSSLSLNKWYLLKYFNWS